MWTLLPNFPPGKMNGNFPPGIRAAARLRAGACSSLIFSTGFFGVFYFIFCDSKVPNLSGGDVKSFGVAEKVDVRPCE